jgi:hypothetical protein
MTSAKPLARQVGNLCTINGTPYVCEIWLESHADRAELSLILRTSGNTQTWLIDPEPLHSILADYKTRQIAETITVSYTVIRAHPVSEPVILLKIKTDEEKITLYLIAANVQGFFDNPDPDHE